MPILAIKSMSSTTFHDLGAILRLWLQFVDSHPQWFSILVSEEVPGNRCFLGESDFVGSWARFRLHYASSLGSNVIYGHSSRYVCVWHLRSPRRPNPTINLG